MISKHVYYLIANGNIGYITVEFAIQFSRYETLRDRKSFTTVPILFKVLCNSCSIAN